MMHFTDMQFISNVFSTKNKFLNLLKHIKCKNDLLNSFQLKYTWKISREGERKIVKFREIFPLNDLLEFVLDPKCTAMVHSFI